MNEYEKMIKYYKDAYTIHGYSPSSLGWCKGKQDVRFNTLMSFFDVKDKSVVDIGCGFGDLLSFFRKCAGGMYVGIDITAEFVEDAKKIHASDDNSSFELIDFLDENFCQNADIFFASGPFNYRLEHTSNYNFIENCMKKAFALSNDGFAFDFLSDKVDWKYDHAWYSNPTVILEIAYGLSRNVALRNDVMPFEFSIAVYKDDSFEKSDTVFKYYKKRIGSVL